MLLSPPPCAHGLCVPKGLKGNLHALGTAATACDERNMRSTTSTLFPQRKSQRSWPIDVIGSGFAFAIWKIDINGPTFLHFLSRSGVDVADPNGLGNIMPC